MFENEENTVHASAGFCDPDGDYMTIAIAKYCHENQWTPNLNRSIDFQEGQIFGNAKLVRKAVKQYAIQEGFMLTKIKNDRSRYTVKCKNETCDWKFHTSCLPDRLTFMIRSLQEKYAIKCDSQTIYKAKKRVLKNLKVDHVNSYAKIRQYANVEKRDTWVWFLELLYDALGWDDNRSVCFISDRQKDLVSALEQTWPRARTTFKNLNMTGKLWAASRVGYVAGFKEVMESIKDDSVKAYDYLMKAGPDKWARYTFDPRIKSDHNTNNIDKPILTLMESLRRKVMVRFHEKRLIYSTKKMLVTLKEKTCNCRLWEISGIPCEHTLTAFSFNRQFAHESVHWYYSNEALKLTYGGNINPVPKEALWPTFMEN
ncbi:hypothetical protein ACOSQ3_011417 [Xanthoceras sorbifolium]